jgi:hypothetical protein
MIGIRQVSRGSSSYICIYINDVALCYIYTRNAIFKNKHKLYITLESAPSPMNSCGCAPELFFEIGETAFTFISDVPLRYMNSKRIYNIQYTILSFIKFRIIQLQHF